MAQQRRLLYRSTTAGYIFLTFCYTHTLNFPWYLRNSRFHVQCVSYLVLLWFVMWALDKKFTSFFFAWTSTGRYSKFCFIKSWEYWFNFMCFVAEEIVLFIKFKFLLLGFSFSSLFDKYLLVSGDIIAKWQPSLTTIISPSLVLIKYSIETLQHMWYELVCQIETIDNLCCQTSASNVNVRAVFRTQ